jgi:cephalosporin hydroxylase
MVVREGGSVNLHEAAPGPANEHGYPNLWPEDSLEHIVSNGFNIGMIQADQEALEYAAYVRDVIRPSVIVELGTLCGGMLYIMDRMGQPGLRVSLDRPWEERDPKPCWPPHLMKRHLPGLVELFGEIHSAEMRQQLVDALAGRSIDLLFIDADHSYEGAAIHWKMYSPLVRRPGGYVAFHDVINGWPCGLFYAQMCQKYPFKTFINSVSPFGIGVLQL